MQLVIDLFGKIANIDVDALSNSDALNLLISASSFFVSALSLVVAAIALIYAAIQYVLKSGESFRGMYSTASSVWSKQMYVSEVVIENTKDKSIAISYIYLRIEKNIYLELANYDSSPRIISPFETIKINASEGVSGYISSTYKVELHQILADRKKKKRLMVVTPNGISKVKGYKGFWNVHFESLRNRFIIPVYPVKKYYSGKEYSDSLQFVVVNELGEEKFLHRNSVFSTDRVSVRVNDFDSSDELRDILVGASDGGNASYRVVKVGYTYHDFQSYPNAEIPVHGYFATIVFGNIYTFFERLKFRLNRFFASVKKKMNIRC